MFYFRDDEGPEFSCIECSDDGWVVDEEGRGVLCECSKTIDLDDVELAREDGIEPPTRGFGDRCSTTELHSLDVALRERVELSYLVPQTSALTVELTQHD